MSTREELLEIALKKLTAKSCTKDNRITAARLLEGEIQRLSSLKDPPHMPQVLKDLGNRDTLLKTIRDDLQENGPGDGDWAKDLITRITEVVGE